MTLTSVCIVAGEASGDKQAALLVDALKNYWRQHRPKDEISFWGVAGPDMERQGVEALIKTEQLAVMGFVEVVAHYFEISKIYKNLLAAIERRQPDVLIVVDYPGFNMRLIADVFARGRTKVFYHIPPKVWAHGARRLQTLAASTHLVTCILPFEEQFLRQHGVVAKFVGNPLFDACEAVRLKNKSVAQNSPALQKTFALQKSQHDSLLIGLCPGSRKSEIGYVLPVLIESFAAFAKKFPTARAVIPIAHTLDKNWFAAVLAGLYRRFENGVGLAERVTLSTHPFTEVVAGCDYAWICSGTATLEAAFLRVPHSIVYRLNELSYRMAKPIVRIPYIGLANWCAGKLIVPEFIQHEATAENLVGHATKLLFDAEERATFLKNLEDEVCHKFKLDAAAHAAEVMGRALEMYSGSDFERNWLRGAILREGWLL